MPTENDLFNDSILYCNGQPIGSLKNININYNELNLKDESLTLKYNFFQNEISFTIDNVKYFANLLSKYEHLMIHSKSLRIRKKNRKTYNRLLSLNMNKFLGL